MPESDLGQLSLVMIYAAMAAYLVALISYAFDLTAVDGDGAKRRKAAGIAAATTWLGWAFHAVGIVLRGLAAGRVPWANMYEFSVVFTFVAVTLFLALNRRWGLRYLGTLITGGALLMLGVAVAVLYVRADGVQPALQSYWLIIHVSVATIATGVFTVAAFMSISQLVKERRELRAPRERVAVGVGAEAGTDAVDAGGAAAAPSTGGRWARIVESLPSSVTLERTAFRLNAVAFVLWTFTIIAGAIWAEHTWGRPWGWDPKEVWSFVIWVIYAAYLHARATRGWEGRRAAYLSIGGFAALLFNYFGVNFLFTSLHSYSGIG